MALLVLLLLTTSVLGITPRLLSEVSEAKFLTDPPMPSAAPSCSSSDPECALDPVDGCDVRALDAIGFSGGNMPLGIDICADNRIVDCEGNTLDGTTSSGDHGDIGIENRGYANVIIRNCRIINYANAGILFDGARGGIIIANALGASEPPLESGVGVDLQNAQGVSVRENQFHDYLRSVRLADSSSNSVVQNTITDYSQTIYLRGVSADNLVNYNALSPIVNSGYAIEVGFGGVGVPTRNRIIGNTITAGGMIFIGGTENTVAQNQVLRALFEGLWISGARNTLTDNTICFSGQLDPSVDILVSDRVIGQNAGDDNRCDLTENWDDDGARGCTYSCRETFCGNGEIDGGEQCDDRNEDPADQCHNCFHTSCGDGVLQQPNGQGNGGPNDDGVEECDGSLGCNPSCTACGGYQQDCCNTGGINRCDDGYLYCSSGLYGVGGSCICPLGATWNSEIERCECPEGTIFDVTGHMCIPDPRQSPPRTLPPGFVAE